MTASLPVTAREKTLEKRGIRLARVLILNKQKNFKYLLKELAKMSIYKVLIEGGGETIAAALESAVVDEVFFFYSPKIIGGRDAKTAVEGAGINKIQQALALKNVAVKQIGNDILVHGKIN